MKTLHRFIIFSYLGPFALTLFISLFILIMQFLWLYIDDLVGKGLEFSVIFKLLFYAGVTFVPMALPLAILLSSIMTLGNLGENYELVALKAAGLSLQKVMRPLIVLSVIISITAFFFSNNMLPYFKLKMGSLLYDVREKKPALSVKEGIFYNGLDGYSIRVGKKDKDGNVLYDVMIYDHRQGLGNNKVVLAKEGEMHYSADKKFLILTLRNGINYEELLNTSEQRTNRSFIRSAFEEQLVRFDLSGFKMNKSDEELFKNNCQMLNLSQLNLGIDSLRGYTSKKELEITDQLQANYFPRSYALAKKADSLDKTAANAAIFYYEKLNAEQKARVLDNALNMARGAKAYVDASANDLITVGKNINKHEAEYHRKFTLSIACFILFFIGAPLGAIIRKGGLGMPVVISLVFFIIFHVFSISGEKMVKEGVVPAWQGMWMATSVILPIGIFLTYKATTDSKLFDMEVYSRFFKKIFSKRADTTTL